MKAIIIEFLRNRNGATAIEYALVAGSIAVGIVAAVAIIGVNVNAYFVSVDNAV